MKKLLHITMIILFGFTLLNASNYEDTVKNWKSHEDLANWMKSNWEFDKSDQRVYIKKLIKYKKKNKGDMSNYTVSMLSDTPQDAFENKQGFCGDAVVLIQDALNKIDPKYDAKVVFIWNDLGKPHHWATAFNFEDKLYVMDFGAGKYWDDMNGIHGPYASLDGYGEFLKSLDVKRFKFGWVRYKDKN